MNSTSKENKTEETKSTIFDIDLLTEENDISSVNSITYTNKEKKVSKNEKNNLDEEPENGTKSPNTITLFSILGGDILSAQLVRNNIWIILISAIFIVIYISNRYSVQKDLIEIDKLNTELSDTKYKALSISSQLTEKTRESHLLDILKTNKDSVLKMPSHPPFIINVPSK